jgi:sodium/bile acid cotransporter 7
VIEMLAHLRERWFLLALVTVLVAGMAWPDAVSPFTQRLPREAVVAFVMLLMALPMEARAMWNAARRPGAAWLGTLVNAGIAPPLGWLASQVLSVELAVGVIVAVVVPCTLAAATVFTRRGGGNDAVAILVTTITNLACFLTVPLWLWLLVGERGTEAGAIDYSALMLQLALLVVAPIAAAQLARQRLPIAAWATRHKKLLSEIAQAGILCMVLVGAVGCGERLQDLGNDSALVAFDIGLMIAVVAAVHLVLLFLGFNLAGALGMNRPDAIAVGIAGSQKTIMVGLYVALAFSPLAILPMVAYHAGQLILDTLVTDWWRRRSPPAR